MSKLCQESNCEMLKALSRNPLAQGEDPRKDKLDRGPSPRCRPDLTGEGLLQPTGRGGIRWGAQARADHLPGSYPSGCSWIPASGQVLRGKQVPLLVGGLGCPVFAQRGPQTLCKRQARGVHVGSPECTVPIGEGDEADTGQEGEACWGPQLGHIPARCHHTHTLTQCRAPPCSELSKGSQLPGTVLTLLVTGSYLGPHVLADVCLTCVSWACTCTHIPGVLRFENGCNKTFSICLLWKRLTRLQLRIKWGKVIWLLRT